MVKICKLYNCLGFLAFFKNINLFFLPCDFSQRNDSREIPEHPRETQKVAATCGVWTKIPQLDHLRIQMNPRTSKKDKAFAVDPQRQASLFASTAQLSTGQMYCIHRSQGLQLVALAFRLHLTKRCLTGLSPDVLWQSYLF